MVVRATHQKVPYLPLQNSLGPDPRKLWLHTYILHTSAYVGKLCFPSRTNFFHTLENKSKRRKISYYVFCINSGTRQLVNKI